MSEREPIEWVEIDVDQCTLNYGLGACQAVLGSTGEFKCFNTYKTCQDKDNYNKGFITLKFYKPQSNLPKEPGAFACLQSVSESSSEVNLAGTNPEIKGLGRRERIRFKCSDFPYGDQFTDKYFRERKTGAAQASGLGYDPYSRGTFFMRLRARSPNYAGRACRYKEGYFDNGVLTEVVTRHYILTNMTVDVSGDFADFEAKDALDAIDDKNAVCPVANNGELVSDITDNANSFTLKPTGIGDAEYDPSGRIIIGSEIMSFTRSGDVMTITGRGLNKTQPASHSAGDSVQQTFFVDRERVDDAIARILTYKNHIAPEYIPTSKWVAEVNRWAPTMFLTSEITKPTGINTLLSEIVQLGVSVYWERQDQEIGLKVNRPPDEDTIFEFSDDFNIKSIDIDDRDDLRLTDIYFYTDIKDPTLSVGDANSYNRVRGLVDLDARSPNEFNDSKIRQVYMRWLGDGDQSLIRVIGKRLLNRFRWSPAFYTFRVAYNKDLRLTDVIRVRSRVHSDVTGLEEPKLMQAISIKYNKPKHEMIVTAQAYQFDQRYARIAPNATPIYTLASDDEKSKYAFFADSVTERLSDGSGAYVFS